MGIWSSSSLSAGICFRICRMHKSGIGLSGCHLHANQNLLRLKKNCAIAEDTTSHSFIVGFLWSPCASPSVWSIWLDHSLCVQSFNCSTTLSLSFSEVFREVCEASHLVVTRPRFMRTTSIVFVVLCQAGLLRNSMERNCFLVGCDGTEPLAQILCESFSCLQLLWK